MASNKKQIRARNNSGDYTLSVSFNESTYSVSSNTSTISASGSLSSSSVGYSSDHTQALFLVWFDNNENINGKFIQKRTFNKCGLYQGNQSLSFTFDVAHKEDGTLQGYVTCYFGLDTDTNQKDVNYQIDPNGGPWCPYANSISTTWVTLTTIPRKTNITELNGNLIGSGMSIGFKKPSNSFGLTIQYSFEGSAWQDIIVKNTSITSPYSWTPSLDLCNRIPNSSQGTMRIKIITYSGDTKIGEDESQKNLSIPSSVVPTKPVITLSLIPNGVPKQIDEYVQGYSKVKVDATSKGVYGSTIKSYQVVCEGLTGGNGSTFGTFTSGQKRISVTATDSRNMSSTEYATINVLPYSKPSILLKGQRCDGSSVPSPSGKSILFVCDYSISSLNNKNKVESQSVSLNGISNTTFKDGIADRLDANLDVATTGKLIATITDLLGNTSTTYIEIPTDMRMLNFKYNKKGLGFGKFAEKDGYAQFEYVAEFVNGAEGFMPVGSIILTKEPVLKIGDEWQNIGTLQINSVSLNAFMRIK